MATLRPPIVLGRPRLLEALESPASLVALVGPSGAGATTLLRQYAERQVSVQWMGGGDGAVPEAASGVLVIDDADGLSPENWERLRARRAADPTLRIRLAVHSPRAVPAGWGVELVDGLAFTLDEIGEYLAGRGSSLDARSVYAVTSGHPAAVAALAQANVTRPERMRGVLAHASALPLDPDLAHLAVPEFLTPGLVADLGGPDDFIEAAERAGQGSWHRDVGELAFALTAPVRAATRASAALTPEREGEVHRIAAARLLRDRTWFAALAEGAASGSLGTVDEALRRGGMPLLSAHGKAIVAALRGIPIVQLRRWPIIAMAQALAFNARREHGLRALEMMGVALVGVQTGPSGSADRALLRVVESVALRLMGLGDGGVRAARAAARTLDELPPGVIESMEGLAGDLRAHSGVSLLYGGHDREAAEQFEQAMAVANRPAVELIALGGLALVDALAGDVPAARQWVAKASARWWRPELLDEYQGSMLRIAEAKIALEHDRLAEADDAIDRIWPIIDTIEHWPLLGCMRAYVDIRAGRIDAGRERLRALRERRGRRMSASRPAARMLDLAESSLALAAGDLASARRLTPRAGDPAAVILGAARVALFDRRDEHALRLLGRVPAAGPEVRTTSAVLRAILLRRLGRAEDGLTAAREAAAIGRLHELQTPFLLLPAGEQDLFASEAGVVPETIAVAAEVPRLTTRERVVLRELVHTASVEEIAARLHVSPNTVKTQRRSLYGKLAASSRDEALAAALSYGLLDTVAPT
jgi:LuxR family maltose regulon positive regulatory protein